MRNHKEFVGCDRIFVLDRIFFRNPKMDESGHECRKAMTIPAAPIRPGRPE